MRQGVALLGHISIVIKYKGFSSHKPLLAEDFFKWREILS